ncbi:MAG: TIGR03905 family TSCPD domain-containing protein [Spirochaetaceae bacterium]|jgi:uncharacterized protein (TIGR03905 family)|nr:TIGR03905 family TSCPD domain-containing protein [Spirochaetaceae bacterium]
MYEYETKGVCASRIFFDLNDGIVRNVRFENGCNGNLKGIGALVEGLPAQDVIQKLRGTLCGRKPTSCPDQLAQALETAIAKQSAA